MATEKGFVNTAHICGRLYQHKLALKVTGPNSKYPGTEFISGDLEIATDPEMTNIVTIHYSYVTALTSKNETNNTYVVLSNIINGTYKSALDKRENGEEIAFFRIDTSINLNEFYSERTGKSELVSAKRCEGGFIHAIKEGEYNEEDATKHSTFTCDMLITSAKYIEEDAEKNLPEKLKLGGFIFDFKKAILPVDFTVYGKKAINYFEGLEPSTKRPTFTQVSGKIVSEIVTVKKEEESAFGGEVMVQEYKNTHKDYVVTWAKKIPYEYGDDAKLTPEYMRKASAERENYLATVKQRQDEYQKSKNNATAPAAGGFDF